MWWARHPERPGTGLFVRKIDLSPFAERLDTPRNSLMDVYGQLPVVRCWVIAGQAAVAPE